MLMFLRNGDPKTSVKMIEMKETNPRPMNSGDPHLQGYERPIGLDLEVSIQFRFRCGDVRTQLEESGRWATLAIVGPSSPIWDTRRADEGGTNHQDDGSGHHRREYSLEDLGRY